MPELGAGTCWMSTPARRLKRSRMSWPSEPGPGDADVSGFGACQCHQLGDRLDAQRAAGNEHEAVGGFHRDMGEVLQRVVADIGIDRRAGQVRAGAGVDEGVAVGLGARDLRGAKRACAAGAVLDEELLLEGGAQLAPPGAAPVGPSCRRPRTAPRSSRASRASPARAQGRRGLRTARRQAATGWHGQLQSGSSLASIRRTLAITSALPFCQNRCGVLRGCEDDYGSNACGCRPARHGGDP